MQRNNFAFGPLKLSYLEVNADNPSKVLIAHANGYAAGCYDYIIAALAQDHHVCALDFAGHGESEGTLDFSSWAFFSDQITAFLNHKEWESCIAIGHSLGGGSLLRAAQADAQRFKKIIAFDPVMLGFMAITYVKLFGNPMARIARDRRSVFKSKEQALKIFQRHPANRSWDKDSVRAYVEYCIREKDGAAELCCKPEIESRIFSQTSYSYLFRLHRITCETHLILPSRSGVCSTRVAESITSRNPRSGIERIPGSGHLLPLEDHATTLKMLEKSL